MPPWATWPHKKIAGAAILRSSLASSQSRDLNAHLRKSESTPKEIELLGRDR